MSYLSTEILDAVIGPKAADNDGHGTVFKVAQGVDLSQAKDDQVAVDMQLDKKSVDDAKGNAEHRLLESDRRIGHKLGLEVPKPSPMMNEIGVHQSNNAQQYHANFSKAGKTLTSLNRLSNYQRRAMARGMRYDHRNQMAAPTLSAKTPDLAFEQFRARRLHQLRRTFKGIEVAARTAHLLKLEHLPQPILMRMAEDALAKGEHKIAGMDLLPQAPQPPVPIEQMKPGMKIDQRGVKMMPGQRNALASPPAPRAGLRKRNENRMWAGMILPPGYIME